MRPPEIDKSLETLSGVSKSIPSRFLQEQLPVFWFQKPDSDDAPPARQTISHELNKKKKKIEGLLDFFGDGAARWRLRETVSAPWRATAASDPTQHRRNHPVAARHVSNCAHSFKQNNKTLNSRKRESVGESESRRRNRGRSRTRNMMRDAEAKKKERR